MSGSAVAQKQGLILGREVIYINIFLRDLKSKVRILESFATFTEYGYGVCLPVAVHMWPHSFYNIKYTKQFATSLLKLLH